jgi:hypothetical protein
MNVPLTIVGIFVALGVTAARAAEESREAQACEYLAKKFSLAPASYERVDVTDFTKVGRRRVDVKFKSQAADPNKVVNMSMICIFDASRPSLTLVKGSYFQAALQEPAIELANDYLKIGGF